MVKLVFSGGGKHCQSEQRVSVTSFEEAMDEWRVRREISDGTLRCQFEEGEGSWGSLWESELYGVGLVIEGCVRGDVFMTFLQYFHEGCLDVHVFGGDGYTTDGAFSFRCTEVPRGRLTATDIEEARLLKKGGYTK